MGRFKLIFSNLKLEFNRVKQVLNFGSIIGNKIRLGKVEVDLFTLLYLSQF